MTIVATDGGRPASGRAAAGQDSRKRRQILDGAYRLFMRQGFDATSMGDIAKEAGVSKGTLYVYFDSKERLFQELVREEKERQFPAIFAIDPNETDVRAVLTRIGRQFARFITQDHVVMAMRTIIAMAERMPDIAVEFYDSGPRQCAGQLSQYFEAQMAAGRLAIADVDLAAAQFLELTQATLSRPLLFGARERPSEEHIDAVVEFGGGRCSWPPTSGRQRPPEPASPCALSPMRRGISGAPRPSSPRRRPVRAPTGRCAAPC